MDFNKEIIGERIKAMRIEQGINAIEIAKAANISKSAISQIEKGVNAPDLKTLFEICKFLKISLDYLCGLSDDPKRY